MKLIQSLILTKFTISISACILIGIVKEMTQGDVVYEGAKMA